ncbi:MULTISPECIES: hypothetical protein [Kribbella]|nr:MULTISPECIES: hypothetical protein [Kribbella]
MRAEVSTVRKRRPSHADLDGEVPPASGASLVCGQSGLRLCVSA